MTSRCFFSGDQIFSFRHQDRHIPLYLDLIPGSGNLNLERPEDQLQVVFRCRLNLFPQSGRGFGKAFRQLVNIKCLWP